MTDAIVTNASDLTPAMKRALAVAETPEDQERVSLATVHALSRRGLVIPTQSGQFRLTVAGKRVLETLERGEPAPEADSRPDPAEHGWILVERVTRARSVVEVWERGDQDLTLVGHQGWDAPLALLNDKRLPDDKLAEAIEAGFHSRDQQVMLERLASHVLACAGNNWLLRPLLTESSALADLLAVIAESHRVPPEEAVRGIRVVAAELAYALNLQEERSE
jgi:hypothetical protein